MIATRVDHGAGSDPPFRSAQGPLWTSRFAVGATLVLVLFFAGAPWEVYKRPSGAEAGIPPHLAAGGVISTGELPVHSIRGPVSRHLPGTAEISRLSRRWPKAWWVHGVR